MSRLDKEREERLEPVRMAHAIEKIEALGYEVKKISGKELQFWYKGKTIRLFPYSGWHSGKTIQDGRGLQKLLNQLEPKK